jgi:hypothetical protein
MRKERLVPPQKKIEKIEKNEILHSELPDQAPPREFHLDEYPGLQQIAAKVLDAKSRKKFPLLHLDFPKFSFVDSGFRSESV